MGMMHLGKHARSASESLEAFLVPFPLCKAPRLQGVQSYAKGVLTAGKVLHENGLVHRDFRRPNVLSRLGDQDGEVVVIDLEHVGLADRKWEHEPLADWDRMTLDEVIPQLYISLDY